MGVEIETEMKSLRLIDVDIQSVFVRMLRIRTMNGKHGCLPLTQSAQNLIPGRTPIPSNVKLAAAGRRGYSWPYWIWAVWCAKPLMRFFETSYGAAAEHKFDEFAKSAHMLELEVLA